MWSIDAIAVDSENSRIAVPASGSMLTRAMIVGLPSDDMYSS